MSDKALLQDVSLWLGHAHCVLSCSYMKQQQQQQQSTDVRQNVQIHRVRLWSLLHCVLFLHSSAGYLSSMYMKLTCHFISVLSVCSSLLRVFHEKQHFSYNKRTKSNDKIEGINNF